MTSPSTAGPASPHTSLAPTGSTAGGLWTEKLRPWLARAGLATEGALYVVIGLLTIEIASGNRRTDTGATGAIETIAVQPYGRWLLGILAIGLLALAAWRIAQAATGDPVEGDDPNDRIGYALRAVVYVGLALAAAATLFANRPRSNGGATSGSTSPTKATAVVMDFPAGRWLVAIGAVALMAGAGYAAWNNSLNGDFRTRLRSGEMSTTTRRAIETVGRVGYLARAVAFALVGVFLLEAAISYNPQEAKGLSASLKTLAGSTWGQLLLWLVALGMLAFGAFRLAEARFREVR